MCDFTTKNELKHLVLTLIEQYAQLLPPYEISDVLISYGVTSLLVSAPSEIVGFGAAMGSIDKGLRKYKEYKDAMEKENEQ
jgi:hypothetical protein